MLNTPSPQLPFLVEALSFIPVALQIQNSISSVAIFYCYSHGNHSSKFVNCLPQFLLQPHWTWLSSKIHSYAGQVLNQRVNQYVPSLIPFPK